MARPEGFSSTSTFARDLLARSSRSFGGGVQNILNVKDAVRTFNDLYSHWYAHKNFHPIELIKSNSRLLYLANDAARAVLIISIIKRVIDEHFCKSVLLQINMPPSHDMPILRDTGTVLGFKSIFRRMMGADRVLDFSSTTSFFGIIPTHERALLCGDDNIYKFYLACLSLYQCLHLIYNQPEEYR